MRILSSGVDQPMKKNYVRRRYFLWKSSQPRLLAGIETIFIILLAVSALVFSLIANRDLTETYLKAHIAIRSTLELLVPSLVIINIIGLIISVILVILFTHRIAGPVYRLCTILYQIGQGNLNQVVKFRKNDELTELDDAATGMLIGLQNHIKELKTISAQLSQDISKNDLDQARLTAQTLEKSLLVFQLPVEKKI
jgi:nitrogen fixation/metabolism regulation signal transduction histidine kinase